MNLFFLCLFHPASPVLKKFLLPFSNYNLLYLLNHFGGFSALTKKYDSETCKLIIWNHISIDLLYNPDFNRMEFQMVRAELERFFYYTKIEKNNLVLRVL